MLGQDVIFNGQAYGPVAEVMQSIRINPDLMRPFYNKNGRRCVSLTTNHKWDEDKGLMIPEKKTVLIDALRQRDIDSPVFNSTTLRKDEWLRMDSVVIREARARLRAWADIAAANTFTVDGMRITGLEQETMNDPGEALVDMEADTEGRSDQTLFVREGLPLPITHCDFWVSKRRLEVSRNSGLPFDTTMLEIAARRVAETVEKTTIGTVTGRTYGNTSLYGRAPKVFGLTNFTDRLTKSDLTAPNGSNASTIYNEFLEMREDLYDQNFYGPFMVYYSTNWDRYLDMPFSSTEPSAGTLRQWLERIDGISGLRRLDYLTSSTTYTAVFVQMTSDVARAVVGMPLQTVQWEEKGGLRLHFKVMCIHAPQFSATQSDQCGILHAWNS